MASIDQIKLLPIEQLQRGKYQPRRHFDPAALEELAQSIRTNGLIQPIIVREIAKLKYEIIAGERRWRAAQLAGMHNVECILRDMTDEEAIETSTIENLQREDLNPIEEASALQRLVDDFGYTHEQIAATIGKSRARVSNVIRLLKLERSVQQMLIAGELNEGHGKVLVALPPNQQRRIAKLAVQKKWSVRKVEQEVKRAQQNPYATIKGEDPNLQALEARVGDQIGCKVGIDFDGKAGQLKINFQNIEILQGVLDKLGIKHL